MHHNAQTQPAYRICDQERRESLNCLSGHGKFLSLKIGRVYTSNGGLSCPLLAQLGPSKTPAFAPLSRHSDISPITKLRFVASNPGSLLWLPSPKEVPMKMSPLVALALTAISLGYASAESRSP